MDEKETGASIASTPAFKVKVNTKSLMKKEKIIEIKSQLGKLLITYDIGHGYNDKVPKGYKIGVRIKIIPFLLYTHLNPPIRTIYYEDLLLIMKLVLKSGIP